MGGPPTGLAPQLAAVHGVARDVAGPIRDPTDEASRFLEGVDDRSRDLEGGTPLAGPDVERLPLDPAGPEEGEEGRAVGRHVNPFPTVLPRAGHGQRAVRDARDR